MPKITSSHELQQKVVDEDEKLPTSSSNSTVSYAGFFQGSA